VNPRYILDRLWASRRRRSSDPPVVGGIVRDLRTDMARIDSACAEVAEFWGTEIPELMPRLTAVTMSYGVVTVATDAATAYTLSRMLRSGLEVRTMRACRTPIKRIKAVVR
jgi:hypothetical protein